MMSNIKYLIPDEENSPVFLCLDDSLRFIDDLTWHFFSEYMHGAKIFVCNFQNANSKEIDEIKQIISRLKKETSFNTFGILRVCGNKNMTEDVVVQGAWLLEDTILCRAIELILTDSSMSYSIIKSDIRKEFFRGEKFLEIKISERILKDRRISYDVDGVKQSKIATTLASIITAVEVAITDE